TRARVGRDGEARPSRGVRRARAALPPAGRGDPALASGTARRRFRGGRSSTRAVGTGTDAALRTGVRAGGSRARARDVGRSGALAVRPPPREGRGEGAAPDATARDGAIACGRTASRRATRGASRGSAGRAAREV